MMTWLMIHFFFGEISLGKDPADLIFNLPLFLNLVAPLGCIPWGIHSADQVIWFCRYTFLSTNKYLSAFIVLLISLINKKFGQKCQPSFPEEFFPVIPNLQPVFLDHVRFKRYFKLFNSVNF